MESQQQGQQVQSVQLKVEQAVEAAATKARHQLTSGQRRWQAEGTSSSSSIRQNQAIMLSDKRNCSIPCNRVTYKLSARIQCEPVLAALAIIPHKECHLQGIASVIYPYKRHCDKVTKCGRSEVAINSSRRLGNVVV